MEKKEPSDDVSIGKFEILATYTYARALLDGLDDDEAKQRGMVAAIIMGARGRLGIRKSMPVAMWETSQIAGKTRVALADCRPRSSLASHAPEGHGGLEPPPTGVENGGSG